MKPSHNAGLLALYGLSSLMLVGCTTVSMPKAKAYSVIVGNTEYRAKSVKIHGNWVEFQTDGGPVWATCAAIKPLN